MRHPLTEIHQSDNDGCLARLRAEVVEGCDTPGEAAKVGTTLHRVAEQLVFERQDRPAADMGTIARRVIREQALALQLSPRSVGDALEILEKCMADDSRLSLWPRPGWSGKPEVRWGLVWDDDTWDFVAIEDPSDGQELYASGTIDLLEWAGGAVEVTDWKTSVRMLSGEDAWASWQGRLYSFAVLRLPQFAEAPATVFRLAMLRHGYIARADFARGDPWEENVRARLLAVRAQRQRAIESGVFPETLGPWCTYCPVMHSCDAMAALREQGGTLTGAATPAEIARAWLAAKALEKALSGPAKDLVDDNEGMPVDLGDAHGTVLGYKPGVAYEPVKSYEQTMAELRQWGMTPALEVEWFRFVQENNYASRVRKAMKELRVPLEEQERLVTPVAKQTFTSFVPDRWTADDRPVTPEELDKLMDRAFGGA